MSNSNARLLGAALIVLSGSSMYGLGTVAYYIHEEGRMADTCADIGIWFIVVGAVLFLVEFIGSWRGDGETSADPDEGTTAKRR